MSSLFEKYGGFATFSQLTKLFYRKLLDSPQVAHFFSHTDIALLTEHQTHFLVSALGGPKPDHQVDLKEAHHSLAIGNEDFNEVIELLEESLEEMSVEPDDIITILTLIQSYKDKIVSV